MSKEVLVGYARVSTLDQNFTTQEKRLLEFGCKNGLMLNIPKKKMQKINFNCALATDTRPFSELLYLQGLPPDYDLPDFTVAGKKM